MLGRLKEQTEELGVVTDEQFEFRVLLEKTTGICRNQSTSGFLLNLVKTLINNIARGNAVQDGANGIFDQNCQDNGLVPKGPSSLCKSKTDPLQPQGNRSRTSSIYTADIKRQYKVVLRVAQHADDIAPGHNPDF